MPPIITALGLDILPPEDRLADSIARPNAVTPWEDIKARALARA